MRSPRTTVPGKTRDFRADDTRPEMRKVTITDEEENASDDSHQANRVCPRLARALPSMRRRSADRLSRQPWPPWNQTRCRSLTVTRGFALRRVTRYNGDSRRHPGRRQYAITFERHHERVVSHWVDTLAGCGNSVFEGAARDHGVV